MATLAVVLLLLGLLTLALAWWWQRGTGLPAARVAYDDSGARRREARPLFDPWLGLVGKPDYLLEEGGALIPVEVKTGATPLDGPYEGHRWQALAYCLLVQRVLGRPAPYAYIRYPEHTYTVPFTPQAEQHLLDLLAEMRRLERGGTAPERSHDRVARCRACGYRSVCDRRLE